MPKYQCIVPPLAIKLDPELEEGYTCAPGVELRFTHANERVVKIKLHVHEGQLEGFMSLLLITNDSLVSITLEKVPD